ncbi:ABC transporter ATP-binding protein [Inconstantimicrobium porci]|uniref:ABC transporter ATP-binding protein n=1 Tax=Inconstantimicrobium porci TaxID=2652291 RepID=UPI0024092D69|nr:ABC transporter ATP-binding protein [Inconstantimicrobium porci]MDD6771321.1 ABC transporter ATP-binding protein [Inconstantimicrobium porci]
MELPILDLENVTKKYDNNAVVDNMTLKINKGEIFGLLGPNGAGKSTTMNMICSLKKPTAGSIKVFGYDNSKEMKKIKERLGYIPQDLAIHENLKAYENVEFFAAMYGLKGKQLKNAVNESLEFVELLDHQNGFAKNFSGGMKRRLNIACVLSHKPDLLIFDEPTVGIDPQSRNFILEKIKDLNKQGSTIIYTSHYMEEVEAICTRIGIMDKGRIIAVGTKDELVSMVSKDNKNMSLEEVFLTMTGKKLRDYGEEVI